MIFIDMMTPVGHVRLNRFYLSHVWCKGDVLVTGEKLQGAFAEYSVRLVPDFRKGILNRAIVAIMLLRQLAKLPDRKVCFLSYDLLFMPLVVFCLSILGKTIFVFEHNTAPTTRAKRIFQKLMGRRVRHFVYAPHISRVFSELQLNYVTISHPILLGAVGGASGAGELDLIREKASRCQSIVFAPSGTSNPEDIAQFAAQHLDKFFVVKTAVSMGAENIFCASRFEDYIEIMHKCDFVYIPFSRVDKVSGPFFEAIGLNKRIILTRDAFGIYGKTEFPDLVRFADEGFDCFSEGARIDVDQFNGDIVRKLSVELHQ